MTRIEKQGGRKPVVSGKGGAWVSDGYDHERKEKLYRIEFRGDDNKTYALVIDEASSYYIAEKLVAYHATTYAYEAKRKAEIKP